MAALPDDALVVRGGKNLPENFALGSGVSLNSDGKLDNVSVNSAPAATVDQLTAPNPKTRYIGIPHFQVGVTSVRKIRAAGGNVVPAPTKKNPYHAIMSGVTPEQASELFRPTVPNPSVPGK